jgi:two-component system phosphate regulon response regulator OmpR
MKHHVLVVDDDNKIRFLICKFLQSNDYLISEAASVKEAQALLKLFIFDIVILDVMLPDGSGIELLQSKVIDAPVILLTALGDVDDRINGLESGAEDYLAKPFDPKELLLRMQKIIKRAPAHGLEWCYFGDFEFNLNTHHLKKQGQLLKLTTNEVKLLHLLATKAGKIVSREELCALFSDINIRTIDVLVKRLRTKIEGESKNPEFLQTIRNQGYILWGELK